MSGLLAGKVAFITGGASGMGLAAALRFLEEGAKVVIADLNRETGKAALEAAKARGLDAIRFTAIDVADEAAVSDAIQRAVEVFGRLDIVFANAGVPGVRGSLLETPLDGFERTLAVNLRGIFLALKHGGRVLKEQGTGGSMIATSSDSALVKVSAPPIYATAKAAVIHLVKEFAAELGPLNIRVNSIAPGAILTPMYGGNLEGHWRPILAQCQPLPFAGEPIDIANMALFLASDLSRFVTGATFLVDGGAVADGGHRFMAQFANYRPPR